MNFKDLAEPEGDSFLKALELAPSQVNDDNHRRFFRMMLKFAAETTDPAIGNAILVTVIKAIRNDANMQLFVGSGFASQVPFGNRVVSDKVFDLLRLLAERAPQAFDEAVIAQLPTIAAVNPQKFLTLLAVYSQNTRHTEVFKVIFENAQLFMRRDCLQNLISLLVWMAENSQRFKMKFGADLATLLNNMSLTVNGEAAADCYTALCHLVDLGIPVDDVPAARIVAHLEDDEVRPTAISFMLRHTPKHGNLTQLVNALVKHARTDRKVSYILVKMARMAKVVQILIDNPTWMTVGLPERVHTLRLFCQVMTIAELREALVADEEELTTFFSGLLTLQDESITLIICSLMKRLPLTPTLVRLLSDRGFIGAYFTVVRQYGYVTQGLILLNQLAAAGYCKEYDTLIDYVIDNIQTKDHCSTALKTATTLCRYQKCKRKLISRRVSEYLYKNHKRGKLVDAFLDALNA